MKDNTPKIKVGVNKPLRPRVVPPSSVFDKAAVHVEMVKAGPVFKNNKLLKFFWESHPTKAAIDATYAWMLKKGFIWNDVGSPVLKVPSDQAEKLRRIRIAMERL